MFKTLGPAMWGSNTKLWTTPVRGQAWTFFFLGFLAALLDAIGMFARMYMSGEEPSALRTSMSVFVGVAFGLAMFLLEMSLVKMNTRNYQKVAVWLAYGARFAIAYMVSSASVDAIMVMAYDDHIQEEVARRNDGLRPALIEAGEAKERAEAGKSLGNLGAAGILPVERFSGPNQGRISQIQECLEKCPIDNGKATCLRQCAGGTRRDLEREKARLAQLDAEQETQWRASRTEAQAGLVAKADAEKAGAVKDAKARVDAVAAMSTQELIRRYGDGKQVIVRANTFTRKYEILYDLRQSNQAINANYQTSHWLFMVIPLIIFLIKVVKNDLWDDYIDEACQAAVDTPDALVHEQAYHTRRPRIELINLSLADKVYGLEQVIMQQGDLLQAMTDQVEKLEKQKREEAEKGQVKPLSVARRA